MSKRKETHALSRIPAEETLIMWRLSWLWRNEFDEARGSFYIRHRQDAVNEVSFRQTAKYVVQKRVDAAPLWGIVEFGVCRCCLVFSSSPFSSYFSSRRWTLTFFQQKLRSEKDNFNFSNTAETWEFLAHSIWKRPIRNIKHERVKKKEGRV